MTWPIPAPGEITSRAAGVLEAAIPGIDARSPNTVAAAIARVVELGLTDLYFFQAYLAGELMPDTAVDTFDRHAAIWGVSRLAATAAIGSATFGGTPGTVVPSAFQLTTPSGATVATTGSGTISGGGTVVLPVAATVVGVAGNTAGGAVLDVVSPLAGLSPQSATLGVGGLAGGTDIEGIEAWRARLLARIRQPAAGGAAADYVTWAKAAGAAYVQVVPNGTGAGTVTVFVAMPGPAAPTSPQLAAIQAAIDVVRPVTALVTVVAATLVPVNVSLHLVPDTPAIRAAATSALQLAFAQDAAIGGTVYVSRLDNAIAAADGEYAHDRTLPAADVVMSAGELPTLGTVTFT